VWFDPATSYFLFLTTKLSAWTPLEKMYFIGGLRRNDNYAQTLLFVGLVMPVTALASYVVNYYLLPRFFMCERYALFFLYFFYLLLAALLLEMGVALATFLIVAGLRISKHERCIL